ncbi:hypothetical protein AYI70_g4687 [Smittium culicis]|uniref:Uncharacterized protein n=1 Tax=Smittium culicis TaxID=133412 RepID=A0A1R1XXU9_9FUNG|nr:hypothetical protein AYI70_g11393 [Smittium culicis]OMJ19511.1 hypothetical protein AYI70_g4687 [Smittium culicis]
MEKSKQKDKNENENEMESRKQKSKDKNEMGNKPRLRKKSSFVKEDRQESPVLQWLFRQVGKSDYDKKNEQGKDQNKRNAINDSSRASPAISSNNVNLNKEKLQQSQVSKKKPVNSRNNNDDSWTV